uniref:Crinkler (CRN) family protein n=1 Tax=Steinernema glaseri TaxID=37863 RepID=A0A1I7YC89_9BILA
MIERRVDGKTRKDHLDRYILKRSTKIPSRWGRICTATVQKIHTLRVLLDGTAEKIYAAALPALKCDTDSNYVPLNSVDRKFITKFLIGGVFAGQLQNLSNILKEITMDALERLVHFIRPVRNEQHPLFYDYESLNTLSLWSGSQWIIESLPSMRLPVESVRGAVKADAFFETVGSLYHVDYQGPALKPNTLDALIEKFVPIDGGTFHVKQKLSEEQMKKLFEKCVVSNKRVRVTFKQEDMKKIGDSTDPINYDKYYSKRKVRWQGNEVLFGNEDKKKLELFISRLDSMHEEWIWSKARLFS